MEYYVTVGASTLSIMCQKHALAYVENRRGIYSVGFIGMHSPRLSEILHRMVRAKDKPNKELGCILLGCFKED